MGAKQKKNLVQQQKKWPGASENKTAWLLAQARATKAVLFSEAKTS